MQPLVVKGLERRPIVAAGSERRGENYLLNRDDVKLEKTNENDLPLAQDRRIVPLYHSPLLVGRLSR